MKGIAMLFGETMLKSFSSSIIRVKPISINMIQHSFTTSISDSAGVYTRYIPSPRPSSRRSLVMNMNSETMLNNYNIKDMPRKPKNFNKGFPTPPKLQTTLEVINSHANDISLTFDPIRHVYAYNGQELKTSVTSFVGSYFSKFDADEIIPKMMNGPNWPRSQYTFPDGKVYTPEQIKKKWDEISEYSRNQGTWMHYNIERFINNLPVDITEPEMVFFTQYHREYMLKPKISPYRTEWAIVAPDINLAGCVDFVGKLPNGNYVIMDWKRSKKLLDSLSNGYGQHANEPIDHLDDCDGSKYSLQLNMYRFILQKYYGLNIESMKLASFHPQQTSFSVVDVPPLDEEVEMMLDHYIANGMMVTDGK